MTGRFDWYAATLDVPPGVIADAILGEVPGAHGVRLGRGRHGYQQSMSVTDGDGELVATILSGGANLPPHAFASGRTAPAFSDLVRRHWRDAHHVTRLDSCFDVLADFDAVHPDLKLLAKQRGLKGRSYIPDDPEDGATYYIGAPSSRVQARVYEKGKEMRAKGHDVPDFAMEMLRFEVQLRPTKEGRVTAASMSAEDVWGATDWTREMAVQHLGYDPGRTCTQFRLHTTFERRCDVVSDQYGHHIFDWAKRLGGWAEFGVEIERRIGVRAD